MYLAAGYDELKEGQTEKDRIRKSRIPLIYFATALRMGIAGEGSGQAVEDDEVECLLANQIYKVCDVLPCKPTSATAASAYAPCSFAKRANAFVRRPAALHRQPRQAVDQHCDIMLTHTIGTDEGLHLARTRHGSDE